MPGLRIGTYAKQRAMERIERLADDALDVATFLTEAGKALSKAVPNDTYCSHMRPNGMEQEAALAIKTRNDEHWGTLRLVRATGRPEFASHELDFLRSVSPHLAQGIRRGLLVGEALEPEGQDAPAIAILREDLTVDSLTPGAREWLSDLPLWEKRAQLPPAVLSVAARALRGSDGEMVPSETTMARVLSERRGWVTIHGLTLAANGGPRVAVVIQQAHPDRITPLLVAAYGLTQREEEVTRHVLRGESTAEMSAALGVSHYTVQVHLKNIFEKVDVRSRRELVGRVFFNHYDPRVHDNGQRIVAEKPVRGGPFPTTAEPRPTNQEGS